MCGICGFYSVSGLFSDEDLKKMVSSLAHRGPDAGGFFVEQPAGLGHRRLSIIDLSAAANQPMISHNERYIIVFNGEVYNFREIENEISRYNSQFKLKTNSDTEVVLEAFSLWGVDFVNKLNGMFAIAIYDKSEKTLYLFRDRVGIKPVYYFLDGNNFAFASELKALKKPEHIYKSLSVNPEAINEYLFLGYIPEPHSIYKNIYKFPSGSWAKFDGRELTIRKYWKIEDKITASAMQDEKEAEEKLKNLLVSSVKYRMISDVPFGTFLSGGIDSGLVTAIAQSLSSGSVKTFNIRFADSKHDESPYAKAISKFLGTSHHEYTVTEKDAINYIPVLLDIYDEPYSDSSAIPTLLVSKMAKQNVTMTLSGDGGDELFMGYGAYNWARRLSNPFIKIFSSPAQMLLSNMSNKYRRAAKLFESVKEENLPGHIFSQEQYYFSRKEIAALLNSDYFRIINLSETVNSSERSLNAAEQQSLFDFNYYLKDDLLVKIDRASMFNSLETRVPLLDYRIVEFAYNLSPDLRYGNGQTKYLLKKVLYSYIPQTFFNRPKHGFSIPLQKWLKNDLKYLIDEFLSEEKINACGVLSFKVIDKLKKDFLLNNRDYLYNRLWQSVILQKFLLEKQGA